MRLVQTVPQLQAAAHCKDSVGFSMLEIWSGLKGVPCSMITGTLSAITPIWYNAQIAFSCSVTVVTMCGAWGQYTACGQVAAITLESIVYSRQADLLLKG